MLPQGSEWILHEGRHTFDGYFKLKEQPTAVTSLTPQADHAHFYAKDKAGVTELFYKNDAGVERDLSLVASAMQGIGSTVSGGTTGSVLFVGAGPVLAQDNANFFWDDSNNELRLGNISRAETSLNSRLQIHSDATAGDGIIISNSSTGTAGGYLNLDKSRGTLAAKTALASGDDIGLVNWKGFGTSYVLAAQIKAIAAAAFSGTVATSRMLFSTTPASSVTLTERMRLMEDGDLIIGHTSQPNAALAGRGLAISRNSSFSELVLYQFGSAGAQVQLRTHTSRGTATTPTATQSGDATLLTFGGFGATAFSGARAAVRMVANQNWTDTAQGAYLTLETTADASTTLTERLRIEASGDISHASGVKHRMLSQNRFRHLNSLAVATHAAQTGLAVNTWNTVTFITEDFDTDTLHSIVSNNSRLTAQITGKYLVGGTVYIDETNIVGRVNAGVRMIKNGGTATIYGDNVSETSANLLDPVLSVAVLIDLAATDYMELQALGSGTSGTFDLPATTGLTRFWMAYAGE